MSNTDLTSLGPLGVSSVEPLVHPPIVKDQYTKVLLIDKSLPSYETFSNSVNSDTFPIVYSTLSSKTELLTLLENNFSNISRLCLAFSSTLASPSVFLNSELLFNNGANMYNDNVNLLIDIIKKFSVQNIDFLACNTLKYDSWKNYFSVLAEQTNVTVGASNNKTGNLAFGGDWVLESTSQDVENMYFTSNIEYYTYLLDNGTLWASVSSPYDICSDGTYMYVLIYTNPGRITRILISDNTVVDTYWVSNTALTTAQSMTYDNINRRLYVACNTRIAMIPIDDVSLADFYWVTNSNFQAVAAITINSDCTYLYISDYTASEIYNIFIELRYVSLINTPDVTLSGPFRLVTDDTYLYVCNYTSSEILKLTIDNISNNYSGGVWANNTQGVSEPVSMIIYNNFMYLGNRYQTNIIQYSLVDPNVNNPNFITTNINNPYGFVINSTGANFYVCNVGSNNIVLFVNVLKPICFKEDTKILTNKGYLPIQDLKKGDLVKTLKNDYLPIDMIGKKDICHLASEERIKDQLYKCTKEQFPEVFEDLVLTGCHCLLVDEFKSDEERAKTHEVNGDIYITDNKYRLPACVDEKTKVYENKGKHTIYHFALENKDYYMNYGVFANGLLVETTSKRFMKELSGMELIE